MNVAIYVRVSTQEQKQHGISVDAQESVCRQWVEDSHQHLVSVYNDAGLSARAKYTKRPAMLKLLDDVKSGKIDLIVFTKLDRWFRNVADYYEVQSVLEQHGVKWRAIQEDYETETASGRFKVNIMLAVAQDEADRTSERIKATNAYKTQKGEAIGKSTVGYTIENKHFVFDKNIFPAMRAFFDTFLDTFSQKEARLAAQALGVSLSQTRTGRILRNPTYYGDHYGVPCPAYITPEQYKKIRQVVDSHVREPRIKLTYLFRGLLRCGICGAALTSSAPYKNRADKSKRIKTYRCCNHAQYIDRCPGTYANEEKLENYLIAHLPALIDAYRADLLSAANKTRDLLPSIQHIEGKLSRLKDLYVDGEISRDVYDRRSAILKEDLSQLKAQSEVTPRDPDTYLLPENWTEVYSGLTDPAKAQFWHDLISRIIIYPDCPPEIIFL